MTKQYHASILSLLGLVTLCLSVSLSLTPTSPGKDYYVGMSTALAEDDSRGDSHDDSDRDDSSHGDSDRSDSHEGDHRDSHRDSDDDSHHSYGSDGYDSDGYDRDGSYDEGHDHGREERGGTSGSAQPFVVKPKINQY